MKPLITDFLVLRANQRRSQSSSRPNVAGGWAIGKAPGRQSPSYSLKVELGRTGKGLLSPRTVPGTSWWSPPLPPSLGRLDWPGHLVSERVSAVLLCTWRGLLLQRFEAPEVVAFWSH